jgi:hypothetical protein
VAEFEEGIVAVEFELKTLTGVCGKAVEDNLAEAIVIQIDIAERLPYAKTVAPTKIVVHDYIATMGKQHVERYNEDGHSQVDEPQVQILEKPYQRAVHPWHTLSATAPRLVLQLLHL